MVQRDLIRSIRRTATGWILQQWGQDLERSLSLCQSAPSPHTYTQTDTQTRRFIDVSLLCQLATWTVRYLDGSLSSLYLGSWLPGRFATWTVLYTWTVRYHDSSLSGRFATWTFCTFGRFDTRTFHYLPGRFATCVKVCSLQYCKNFFVVRWQNVQGASETSSYRNVQMCESSR